MLASCGDEKKDPPSEYSLLGFTRPSYIDINFAEFIGLKKGTVLYPENSKPIMSINIFVSYIMNYANVNNLIKENGAISVDSKIERLLRRFYSEIRSRITYTELEELFRGNSTGLPVDEELNPLVENAFKVIGTRMNALDKICSLDRMLFEDSLQKVRIKCNASMHVWTPRQIGLSYYTESFRKIAICLLCIHRFHMRHMDKNIFIRIITDVAKNPIHINLRKIAYINSPFVDASCLTECEDATKRLSETIKNKFEEVSELLQRDITINDKPIDVSSGGIDFLSVLAKAVLPVYIDRRLAKLFGIEKDSILWPFYSDPISTHRIISNTVNRLVKNRGLLNNKTKKVTFDDDFMECFGHLLLNGENGMPCRDLIKHGFRMTTNNHSFITKDVASKLNAIQEEFYA